MPKRKASKNQNKLKLLNYIDESKLFRPDIFSDFLPEYITDNMKHELRGYQQQALQNLEFVEQMDVQQSNYFNQLMFYMATGSGKTDVMAAIILYMYTQGYKYFLFTVSSSAVINKTRQNLINSGSFKYLYQEPITIDGKRIQIKEVENYPSSPEEGVIYIRLATIQTLSNDIDEPHENGMTLDELAKYKMVILADEAHHFNVQTKGKKKESRDWETLLNVIRNANSDNQQFEFTATIDLNNQEILNKYQDKIVFEYDLSNFIEQGYSKEVYKLQANNDDQTKILNAVLLSQYRKRIAINNGIQEFKPVILFKSNQVKTSGAAEQLFLETINKLNTDNFAQFINTQSKSIQSDALSATYKYWLTQDIAETVNELKHDFSKSTTLNANDSKVKGIMDNPDTFDALNTLEQPTNPIRVVFAVAKLNEGWDVLNLYDIVRINEDGKTRTETNAEAQLIGRGARYNPFIYQGKKSYRRRFDNDDIDKQLLERLYYHTINDTKYLELLIESLDAIDLPMNDDSPLRTVYAKVKPSFKRTDVFKNGNVFYNLVEDIPLNHYDSIDKYGINVQEASPIDMVNSVIESKYDDTSEDITGNNIVIDVAKFNNDADKAIIRTGIQRNKFFRFKNIKQYCPTLDSMETLLHDTKWLGEAIIKARIPHDIAKLTNSKRLEAVDAYLNRIETSLKRNFNRDKGTNEFAPLPINELVKDYSKKIPKEFNFNSGKQHIREFKMKDFNYFVYDKAIVNDLEYKLIEKIGNHMPEFQNDYNEIYLIRIDEQASDFKLHDFGGNVTHYSGYMPDFILYLENKDYIYQVYIEPKGDTFIAKDSWKEDLLEKIEPDNVHLLADTDKIKLYGVKFFIRNNERHIFKEMKDKGIIK